MTTPVVVTGADGMLGSAVVRAGIQGGLEVVALSKRECDITDMQQVEKALEPYSHPIVINCAGIVQGRDEVSFIQMSAVNSQGPHILSVNAGRLIQVSTDCVFDGALSRGGYDEADQPNPQDVYAVTKRDGEIIYGPHLTVRVSFVGLGQRGLLRWLLSHPEGAEVPGYTNWLWNGWTASTLARRLVLLAVNPQIRGLLHLPGPQVMSKGALLTRVARRLRPDLHILEVEAPDPRRMVLESRREAAIVFGTTWDKMLAEMEEEFALMTRRQPQAS